MNATPSFFGTRAAKEIYLPRYDEIVAEAQVFAKANNIKPASMQKEKIAVFSIDEQVGFCIPGASLYVPGAENDTMRGNEFILRNIDKITSLHYSMDTHFAYQIFHPSYWVDSNGNHPAAFTPITMDDIKSGKWMAINQPKMAYEYVEKLESTGKYVLMIWPFHTMLGSIDHALVPQSFEVAHFFAMVRKTSINFEMKGTNPYTENYSVLSPEVKKVASHVVGNFNSNFFKVLMENDRVYIKGQASSHCVKETIEDMLREIKATDPSLVSKIYILIDAMSPVPAVCDSQGNIIVDFPQIADDAFVRFEAEGMHIVKTSDDIK